MSKIIICWPESQELMEFDGFRENCSLINGERGLDVYGSSAYLVDKDWYDEWANAPIIEDDDIDIDNDNENEYDDNDCELQHAYDWELVELGFLDEDDDEDDDE